jgi:hypothetical protein
MHTGRTVGTAAAVQCVPWERIMSEMQDRFEQHTFPTTSAGRRRSRVGVGLLAAGAMTVLAVGYVAAQGRRQATSAPITIQKQGSFAVGGKVLGDPATRSLHCDHGYVDYQIPVNPRRINLVMWHSAAATAWLNRWDGGEGYQSIFLRRGYPVYIWDGPQVGRANWGCAEYTYKPGIGRDQGNFTAWRFGAKYPNWFEGVQFPTKDLEAWNQASRARYVEFDTVENAQMQSDAAATLMNKIGPSVALTNSAGGMRAILTALKTNNLAGIVMYENVGYVYPEREGPGGPVGGFGPIEVPLEEFKKLTKIPMQMVWGDNVDKAGNYADTVKLSRLFAEKVNKYGGRAQVLMLADAGLKGNTHIPFADMNNVAVADLLSKFLAENGLDKR